MHLFRYLLVIYIFVYVYVYIYIYIIYIYVYIYTCVCVCVCVCVWGPILQFTTPLPCPHGIVPFSFYWGLKERKGWVHQSISYSPKWAVSGETNELWRSPDAPPAMSNPTAAHTVCAFIVVLSMVLKSQTCVYWSRLEVCLHAFIFINLEET